MFYRATTFNQPLNKWNVKNVINMEEMFCMASSFNQPLNIWCVCNVIDMRKMFCKEMSFKQSLDDWDVSNVKHMREMFANTWTKIYQKPIWYQLYIITSCRCEKYMRNNCYCNH